MHKSFIIVLLVFLVIGPTLGQSQAQTSQQIPTLPPIHPKLSAVTPDPIPLVYDNISEYFRDQLGTPMTFDSSTQGWTNYGSTTVTQSNGELKVVYSGTSKGVKYNTPNEISKNVYTNISFDLYCNIASTIQVNLRYDDGLTTLGNFAHTFSCTTAKTTFTALISSFTDQYSPSKEPNLFSNILFTMSSGSATTFYLDNFQLLGSFNYPTMNLGTNWGFDSSKEYFWDQVGENENFATGTTMSWTNTTALQSLTNPSTYLQAIGNTNYIQLQKTSLSIASATYYYGLVEFVSNVTLSSVKFMDNSGNPTCTVSTGLPAAGSWGIANCQFTAHWSATESQLQVGFTYASTQPVNLTIQRIYLYDSDKGNVQNWNGTYTTHYYTYVDPQGYQIIHQTVAGNGAGLNGFSSSSIIDTSIYKYLTIRMKSSIATSFYFQNNIGNVYATLSLTTSFQTFTFDLSQSSSYWTGIINANTLLLLDGTGGLNSVFTIDYILLTATNKTLGSLQLTDQTPNNPSDNIYISQNNTIYYSNDQVMNNSFTLEVNTTYNSSLSYLNVTQVFGLDYNQSYTAQFINLTYWITGNATANYIQVKLRNTSNMTASSIVIPFVLDNTPPSQFIVRVIGNNVLNISQSIDSGVGLAYYAVFFNNVNQRNVTAIGLYSFSYLPSDYNAITVYAYDLVNNRQLAALNSEVTLGPQIGTQTIHGLDINQNPLDQVQSAAVDNQNTLFALGMFIFVPALILILYRRIK